MVVEHRGHAVSDRRGLKPKPIVDVLQGLTKRGPRPAIEARAGEQRSSLCEVDVLAAGAHAGLPAERSSKVLTTR
jgi:hypothetical protein